MFISHTEESGIPPKVGCFDLSQPRIRPAIRAPPDVDRLIGDYVVYKTPMTGRLKAGTYPYRNMRGGTAEAAIIVGTEAAGFIFNVPQAGTVPQRNVIFQGRKSHITAETAMEMFKYRNIPAGVTEAGKTPQRSARGGVTTADITAQTEAEGSTYAVPVAGTVPGRNTHQQTAGGSVTSQAEGTGFKYNTRLCGSPRKL